MLQLLQQRGVALAGSHALVIGRSRIVGSPLAAALLAADATVSVAHSRTKGLGSLCRSADVIVSCAGYPGLVRGGWVKDGAAVVSVGTTFAGERLLSDLEEAERWPRDGREGAERWREMASASSPRKAHSGDAAEASRDVAEMSPRHRCTLLSTA